MDLKRFTKEEKADDDIVKKKKEKYEKTFLHLVFSG